MVDGPRHLRHGSQPRPGGLVTNGPALNAQTSRPGFGNNNNNDDDDDDDDDDDGSGGGGGLEQILYTSLPTIHKPPAMRCVDVISCAHCKPVRILALSKWRESNFTRAHSEEAF
ncbi:hypothetical protein PABG_11484 [Paracoccidioides brasiliensis Pb03]|nr:hypothetical protein PABG_11484 [Paracoccidioides brasiliensis Pb03]